MIIKYISLIFGAIFEVYTINMYMSAFSEKRKTNKYRIIISYIIITIFQIFASFFFQGTILLLCSLITSFSISQIYKMKQYIKLILTITVVVISVAGEMLVSGILMMFKSTDFKTLSIDQNIYSLGVLLSKFLYLY